MKPGLNARAVFVLGCGLLAISTASIWIKLCDAPALTITLYRVGLASLFYFGVAGFRGEPIAKSFSRRQLWLAMVAGVALSLHFITWITSLSYTSVACSVVLVVTSPMWVALGSFFILKEKPPVLMLLGMAITFAGSLIVSGADLSTNPSSLFGNLLAMAGAVFVAIYFLIGRRLRGAIAMLPYVATVYAAAAITTFLFILIRQAPVFGFDLRTYVLLGLVALLPQVIGHTSFNWALKYFSATAVSIVTLGEPIGATILAWLILGESISLVQAIGGLVILAGLVLSLAVEAAMGKRRQEGKD